jgi:hypothetical protein
MTTPEVGEHSIEMEKGSSKYLEGVDPQSAEFDMHNIYTYHERSAGRLVIDPEYIILNLYFQGPNHALTERQKSNLETNSRQN